MYISVSLGQYETRKFGKMTVHKILYNIVNFCIFLCISIFMVLGCNHTRIYIVIMETSDIITIPTTLTSIIIVFQGKVHPDFLQKAKGLTLGFKMPMHYIIYSIIPHHIILPGSSYLFDTYCM